MIKDGSDQLVIGKDGLHELLGWIRISVERLFYLHSIRQMHHHARCVQHGIPEGIELLSFPTGHINRLVGHSYRRVVVHQSFRSLL